MGSKCRRLSKLSNSTKDRPMPYILCNILLNVMFTKPLGWPLSSLQTRQASGVQGKQLCEQPGKKVFVLANIGVSPLLLHSGAFSAALPPTFLTE